MNVYLPWWREHYRYMPSSGDVDGLFEERVNELRADREFHRAVVRRRGGQDLAVDLYYNERTVPHFDSAKDVKVHPDYINARYTRPDQQSTVNPNSGSREISEDILILGAIGADTISDVDPHLCDYNKEVDDLYGKVFRTFGIVKRYAILTGNDMTHVGELYEKATKRCRRINRMSIEDYIQENPKETADNIIGILRTKLDVTRQMVSRFAAVANKFIREATVQYLHGPHRNEILREYETVKTELMKSPVKNFIEIAIMETINSNGIDSLGWVILCNDRAIEKLYRIAWEIETNGYSSLHSGVWPASIDTIEDFVVIAYQLLSRKNTTSVLNFTHRYSRHRNIIESTREVYSTVGSVQTAYNACKQPYESGVAGIYEEYCDFVERAVNGPQIGNKPLGEYITDSIYLIEERGKSLIKKMEMLNKQYVISQQAKLRSGRAALFNANVSPLDYETSIQNAVQLVMRSKTCIDDEADGGPKEVAFTKFKITDDNREDGIGLCFVLKQMKNYVGTIVVADKAAKDGSHWRIGRNHYNVFYRTLQEFPYGKPFELEGLIFWKTIKTPTFIRQLQKTVDMK